MKNMCWCACRGLTCDGVVMVGSVGEGLQEVSLVLKGVVDLSFKVLEAGNEVVERLLGVRMVQHAAGRDLQPAVALVDGGDGGLAPLRHRSRLGPPLQRQHLSSKRRKEPALLEDCRGSLLVTYPRICQ